MPFLFSEQQNNQMQFEWKIKTRLKLGNHKIKNGTNCNENSQCQKVAKNVNSQNRNVAKFEKLRLWKIAKLKNHKTENSQC